jgi:hypothetical protein
MIFLIFSLAKNFSDYIDYDKKNNIPPEFFIHTKCVFFKPHNNSLNINIMILIKTNLKEVITAILSKTKCCKLGV